MLTRFRLLTLLSVACATAAATEPQFPLELSANRRQLVDQNGAPFLYNADTPWMLFLKLTETEASEYMARRKEQGFNALQVQLTGFLGMTNLAGELPFAATPPDQDLARPNERFFAHVDRVIAEAERQGLLLAVAYLPVKRALTVDLSKVSGKTVKVWWFNPRTGAVTSAGQFAEKKRHTFDPPDDSDWVLVLDDAAKRFPAPGSKRFAYAIPKSQ